MAAYKKLTDDELVNLVKRGDQAAFTEIYNRYSESLAGFAASKLYNLNDAKDILHDLFVNLWTNRDQLNITSTLQSYLFAVIRHRIIDKIRKNITREEYALMVQSLPVSRQDSTNEQAEAKELEQAIQKSLDQLSPRVKEIYSLSRTQNLSNRDIAERLNLSEQTVKNQLTVALNHLRKSLNRFTTFTFVLWWLS